MTEERFTPQMHVDYYAAQRGISIKDVDVAPIVVVSWNLTAVQAMADAVKAQPAQHWLSKVFKLYTGQVQGQRVSFAHVPIGAPSTVTTMEVMIVCGARLFLGLGWAGSLQPHAPVGTFLIPTSCVREEGTSFHYVEDDAAVVPDKRLVVRLERSARAEDANVFLGPHWTTDAPFRETVGKIATFRRQGVLGVDMETSAMYALGRFRNVAVCNLLVVSDELWQDWNPAWGTQELVSAMQCAQRVVWRVLESGDLL